MLPCAYKKLFGIDCPACGGQRSLALLLEGNFRDSFLMYPPLIPVLIMAALWVLNFFKPGLISFSFTKKFTWVILALVMINYIIHFFI